MAQTDAYLAKYDPTEEGLKIVHAAYKNGTLSEPLYLEFTNDLTHRRIREAHPQTPDESGGGEGVRGRVRGSDAGSSEEATRGLRSPLLKVDTEYSQFVARYLKAAADVVGTEAIHRMPDATGLIG